MMKKLIICVGCLLLSGCVSRLGPDRLPIDTISYNHAVQQGYDTQLLLNIVRLRYRDTPNFLNYGVISSAYEFRRGANIPLNINNRITSSPSVHADITDKPTTTYQSVHGQAFVSEFLSPIKLEMILLLNSSGWRIDRLLRCCVQRMNGILYAPNASGPTPEKAPAYREFLELTDLFYKLEESYAIDIYPQKEGDHVDVTMVFDKNRADPSVLARIWQLLELDPGTYSAKLIPWHGTAQHEGDTIAVETRSPLGLLYFLSQSVDVPYTDELAGLVTVTEDRNGYRFNWGDVLGDLFKVYVACDCPCTASTGIQYRGYVYYIDDSDLVTKSTFSLLSQLFALQTGCPVLPALTIPLN